MGTACQSREQAGCVCHPTHWAGLLGRARKGLQSTSQAETGNALGCCGDSPDRFPGQSPPARLRAAGLRARRQAVGRGSWAAGAGTADRAGQKRSGFDSLLQPPLEGRRMPGIRAGPAPRSLSGAVGTRGCFPWQRGPQARQGNARPHRDPAQSPGGAWVLLPTSDPRLRRQCPGGRTGSRCGAARRGPSRRRASVIPCWSGAPGWPTPASTLSPRPTRWGRPAAVPSSACGPVSAGGRRAAEGGGRRRAGAAAGRLPAGLLLSLGRNRLRYPTRLCLNQSS